MNKKFSIVPLASALLMASSYSFGNGFTLNEQSVSGLGTAYAGRSSSALDASTVYGNPAGMSHIKKEMISGGFVLVVPDVSIDNYSANGALGPVSGSVNNDITDPTPVPFGYYVKPLDDKWSFGFGIYAPFGQGTDYDDDSAVRYLADKTEVTIINLQPTLSYKINDQFSVGAGLIASYANATFGSRLPVTDGSVEAKGDDWSYGYNLGVLYDITPSTRVGLTYHSKIKYDLDTKTKVRNLFPAFGPANEDIDGTLTATTPESVDISLTHALDDRWTVYGGGVWTRWSRWQAITIENTNSPTPLFNSIGQDLHWHNSWGYSLGASYQLSPQWVLRTGVAFDESPAGSTQNARLPIADRKIFSIGAGWRASEDLTVDIAYSYLHQNKLSLSQQDDSGNTYQADYKAAAHGLGVQLNYTF